MSAPAPRPGILTITPYVGGESRLPGIENPVKLSSNEGALGPSPRAVDAYRAAADAVHRYPDGHAVALREAIAERFHVRAEQVVCGAGSDELLALLAQAYAGPGDEVLHSEHGFLMYPIAARAVDATPVAAPEANLTADVDALLARVSDRTRIVYLANPNNPTGTWLSRAELGRLRAGLPDHVLLVLDAAYAEFADAPDYSPGIDLVEATDNTVMTRTFSKIFALSGLRLGWCHAPPHVVDVLNRIRGPFNVSGPAQAAGEAAVRDEAFFAESQQHNAAWRPWFTAKLRGLGLDVPDSGGNFVLARFPGTNGRTAEAADAFLRGRGIIARRMGSYGLPDSLRITIGAGPDLEACADALTAFMEGGHGVS